MASLWASQNGPAPDSPQSIKYTVLYIEDNTDNLELVRLALKTLPQINFISAPDALSGIEQAVSYRPHLILMDIQLPGMDGFAALNQLKKKDITRPIPVIALSANALDSDVQNALNMGFSAYVTKPLQIDDFLRTIEKFLNI